MTLCLIIGIVVFFLALVATEEFCYSFLWGLLALFLAFLILMIPCGVIENHLVNDPKAKVEETVIDIYALKDNTQGYGNFFLGTGTYKEDPVYYYVAKDKFGKKVEHLSLEDNDIYVNDDVPKGEQPTLIVYKYTPSSWIKNHFFLYPEKTIYVFNIPKGSITSEFEIDLE